MDAAQHQPDLTVNADTRSELERFDDTLKLLLRVPKEELDRRELEYQRQRDEARGHKRQTNKKQPG